MCCSEVMSTNDDLFPYPTHVATARYAINIIDFRNVWHDIQLLVLVVCLALCPSLWSSPHSLRSLHNSKFKSEKTDIGRK